MQTVRELDCPEFREIYQNYVKKDFPVRERRPWVGIQKAWKDGNYSAFGYEEDGRLLAYASLFAGAEVPYVLLDYYAVMRELRGQGIGSAFLRRLPPAAPRVDGIFIEAEDLAAAGDEEERRVRERRLSFYCRNGATQSGVSCHLFGTDYALLYLPVQKELRTRDVFFREISALYRDLYHPFDQGKLCRVYTPGEDGESD